VSKISLQIVRVQYTTAFYFDPVINPIPAAHKGAAAAHGDDESWDEDEEFELPQVRSSSSLLSIITCLAFAIKHSPHRITSSCHRYVV
jgi:hypothetical protein